MVHLDLFSGIGGFAYAVDQVWDDVEHIFCDNEPFAREVLKKHWPESKIYDDIKEITADSYKPGRKRKKLLQQGRQSDRRGNKRPFLLTGGFPCQPFSAAGNRRGTADDRYLWPEMLRVIRLTQPQWVIAENVGGLVTWNDGMVLETVCLDLEAAGYEAQPFIIPAVAVNAPHRRDRIWFVAHTKRGADGGTPRRHGSQAEEERLSERNEVGQSGKPGEVRDAEDAFSIGGRGRHESGRQVLERQSTEVQDERPSWESNWFEVATQFCSVDDGLPVELDGFKLSKSKHRAEQLKAYGNAIVPQIAVEIMKSMELRPTQGGRM